MNEEQRRHAEQVLRVERAQAARETKWFLVAFATSVFLFWLIYMVL